MANSLHPNDTQHLDRHLDSMMASLARRIEAAKQADNLQLIELLEQEKQQVRSLTNEELNPTSSWFAALKQAIVKALFGGSDLQVCHFVNGSDEWWYLTDPRTGQQVYADSEAELRLWIKENYHGQ